MSKYSQLRKSKKKNKTGLNLSNPRVLVDQYYILKPNWTTYLDK